MSKGLLFAIAAVVALALPTVSALTVPGLETGSGSGSIFSITPYTSILYAVIFGMAIFVILNQALQRTSLRGGAASISLLFGAITSVLLYTNSALLQIFLNISATLLIFIFLLAMLIVPSKQLKGRTATKLIGTLVLLVMMYLIFTNPAWSNFSASANRAVGFNIAAIISYVIVLVVLALIIISFVRLFRRSRAPLVRIVVPFIVIYILLSIFVPGLGAFLLQPVMLAFYVIVIVAVIAILIHIARGGNKDKKHPMEVEQKSQIKQLQERQLKQLPAPQQLQLTANYKSFNDKELSKMAAKGDINASAEIEKRITKSGGQAISLPSGSQQAKKGFFGRREEKDEKYNTNIGGVSVLDRRIKPPLWFSLKSPVDDKGKLDSHMQHEIENQALKHRREFLSNQINSGKMSGKSLKNAKNEMDRIDYRLRKHGGDIHR